MKKVLTLVAVAGMFSFVACGPSAEEIAAKEKAKQDSIAAVEAAQAAEEAAKLEAEAKEKATQDSIAAAQAAQAAEEAKKAEEEAAKAKKGSGKKTSTPTEKKAEEVKKVTGGRG